MMRRAFVFSLFVILGVSCAVFAQQQAPPPPPQQATQAQAPTQQGQQPLVTNVRLVDLLFTVVNKREKFVTDLEQTDFKVLEDNRPQQIRFFSRQTDLPLRVALLMDTSNSIRQRLKFEQDAATDFLYNVLRPNRDSAFLMTFDSDPDVVLDYTSDLDKLRNAINDQRAGGGTALYEAIVKASQKLANAPLPEGANPNMRRVLVVISDGEDNLSRHTRADAIEAAQRSGVVIYPISTSTEWVAPDDDSDDAAKRLNRKYLKNEGDEVLTAFANETGGRAFFPYHVEDVSESFLDIGTELRSQYSLAYSPMNGAMDGKFRKIQIEVVGRKGLDVRTRKGYYAVPPIVSTLVPGEGQSNQ